ncbi:MAG: hypothetical protein Q9212_003659 [Teloschistes hypoglaucus]
MWHFSRRSYPTALYSRKDHGQSSTVRVSSPGPPPDGTPDPAKASPKTATSSRDPEPDNSLWARAYKDLAQDDPKLIQKLNKCLKINVTDIGTGVPACSDIGRIVNDAIEEIANTEKAKHHSQIASAAQQCSDKAIPIIVASKDLIGSALSANPYAALAWSGVSLLLPEREAAQKGLDYVVVLMEVYQWHEKSYILRDELPDLERRIVRLYLLLLEYQATLLINLHKKAPAQWAKAVFESGNWSSRVNDIQGQDAHCKDLINAVAGTRTIDWRDEERRWQHELLQQPRQQEENRHIQMLYSNYEQGKNVNPERIPGTCEWFLHHPGFLTWRKIQKSSLLWLSADPGCGKSVLSKFLVDRRGEVLSVNPQPPTVCYFFFKDGDVDRTNATNAICATLHQLIMQQPQLYKYAEEDFSKKNGKFLEDFDALWGIFNNAMENSSSQEIVCVLDALDECHEKSRTRLITQLKRLYSHHSRNDNKKPILKFLLTSRPEFNIVRDLEPSNTFSEVRLRGEEESESISHEIDLVIKHRMKELAKRLHLSETDESTLRKNLCSIPHRTYLWLHLMFDDLWRRLDLSKNDIATVAKSIPKDVNQAYTAILNKSPDKSKARQLLHIILAAVTPLSIQEVNVAMVVGESTRSYEDLDWWIPETTAAEKIKNTCGLFLSVLNSKVYLIHQTAREFLVGHEHNGWCELFNPARSNLFLAEACIWFLRLRDLEIGRLQVFGTQQSERGVVVYDEAFYDRLAYGPRHLEKFPDNYVLLSYAATNWSNHLTLTGSLAPAALIQVVAQEICDPLSYSWRTWAQVYVRLNRLNMMGAPLPRQASKLNTASLLGLHRVVALLLEQENHQLNYGHSCDGNPLSWAARKGHQDVVKLLLSRDHANTGLPDNHGRTPVWYAADGGHKEALQLLLVHDSEQAEVADQEGNTPLLRAVLWGRFECVSLLLEKGVQVNPTNNEKMSLLAAAACGKNASVLNLLLARKDVRADIEDQNGHTPLALAVLLNCEEIVKLLIDRSDVQVDLKDHKGRTPLSYAAEEGYESLVNILLQRNADTESKDKEGRTPLPCAAEHGRESVVSILIQRNVDIESRDKRSRTPLYYAADREQYGVVKLLLESGADVESQDIYGRTALHWTFIKKVTYGFEGGKELVIVALLENGAEINHKDSVGRTPLSNACYFAGKDAVYLAGTLDEDLEAADSWVRRYLFDLEGAIKLLVEKGAEVDPEDEWKRTPLFYAACNGVTEIVKLLLKSGARLDSSTIEGTTPLDIAKSNKHEEVVQLLETHLAQKMVS